MYNSPIEMIIGNMQMQQEGEIIRAVQEIGVNVDKDELLKALQYDRGQYEKGYKDGIKEFAKELMYNLDGDIEAYANAGHGLNIYEWLISYLVSKGAIEAEGKNG